jgi:hypothetical protein
MTGASLTRGLKTPRYERHDGASLTRGLKAPRYERHDGAVLDGQSHPSLTPESDPDRRPPTVDSRLSTVDCRLSTSEEKT